jgi:periplasmic protein CpxP/Spy
MSQLRIFITLLTLLSVATTAPVQAKILIAQNPSPQNGPPKIPAGGMGKLVEELNLTPEQIHRLQKLRAASGGKTKERRQALRVAKHELAQLLQSDASIDRIRLKRQQVQALQKDLADDKFEGTLAIREILTPEQRMKLHQLMEQRHQNRGKLN